MNTYTILLDGLFYALGMDLFCENVYALETPSQIAPIPKGTGIKGRNDAIRTVCHGYRNSKDAFHIAKRCGNYVGMLYTNG